MNNMTERNSNMTNDKTGRLVLTALMACLVLLATYMIRIPSPFTQGYIHLGDTMIFLSVLVLGKKSGAAAAGLGSALADLLGGYAAYAIWTFMIKGLMAFIMGAFIERAIKKNKHHRRIGSVPVAELAGMVVAGIEMVIGYAAVDGILAGNMMTGILGAPFNVIQFVVGLVLATILAMALYKTPAAKLFAYRVDEIK